MADTYSLVTGFQQKHRQREKEGERQRQTLCCLLWSNFGSHITSFPSSSSLVTVVMYHPASRKETDSLMARSQGEMSQWLIVLDILGKYNLPQRLPKITDWITSNIRYLLLYTHHVLCDILHGLHGLPFKSYNIHSLNMNTIVPPHFED